MQRRTDNWIFSVTPQNYAAYRSASSASDSLFMVLFIWSLLSLNLPDNSVILLLEEAGLVWSLSSKPFFVMCYSDYSDYSDSFERKKDK